MFNHAESGLWMLVHPGLTDVVAFLLLCNEKLSQGETQDGNATVNFGALW